MIRAATLDDIPSMVDMGRHFFEASGYADITRYDAESFAQTLTRAMDSTDAVFLVVEKDHLVGMAGALLYPFYFNLTHRTAQELFWWVEPEHRGVGSALFDAMTAEIQKRGAESLSMVALETLEPEKVGAFYQKRGFRPSERSFIRSL